MNKLKIFGKVIAIILGILLFIIVGIYFFFQYKISKIDDGVSIEKKLDKKFNQLVLDKKIVGASVCIIKGDHIYMKSFGYADLATKRMVDSSTLFEIGSISKVFTTELAEILHQKKIIDWNEPIHKSFPFETQVKSYEQTKLLHLASHTSGFPSVPEVFFPKVELDTCNPYSRLTINDLQEYLKNPKDKKEPNIKEYDYSNLGNGLLGHILEWKTKEKYNTLLQMEICQKINMKNTSIIADTQYLAQGYNDKRLRTCHWDFPILYSAGAIKSNIQDMGMFLNAQLNDPYFQNILNSTRQEISKEVQGYVGKGWFTETITSNLMGQKHFVWHNGGTFGFSSFIGLVPEEKIGIVILANQGDINTLVDQLGFSFLVIAKKSNFERK
jgi:CubicO group peptidase (beta-lactamase class C family)